MLATNNLAKRTSKKKSGTKKKPTVKNLRVTVKKLREALLNLETKLNKVEVKVEEHQVIVDRHEAKISEVSVKVEDAIAEFDEKYSRLYEGRLSAGEEILSDFSSKSPNRMESPPRVQEPTEPQNSPSKSSDLESVVDQNQLELLRPFQCNLCPQSFIFQFKLTRHLISHETRSKHFVPPEPVKCDECNKIFATQSSLTNHKRLHSNDRSFHCHVCDLGFKRKDHLKNHLVTHAAKQERPFSCPICSKAFTRESTLKDHMAVHRETRAREPYKCEICGLEFVYKRCLETHLRLHTRKLREAQEKGYSCSECGQKFSTRYELGGHSRSHHKTASCRCLICNIRFSRPYGLQRHQQQKHSNPESNPAPKKKKILRKSLPRQIKANNEIVEKRKNLCEICGIHFARPDSLRRHLGKKHPELKAARQASDTPKKVTSLIDKLLRCTICYKPFTTSASLFKHTTLQHGYNCSFCRDSFSKWERFQNHIATCHEDAFTKIVHINPSNRIDYACKICDKKMSKDLLLGHAMTYHAWDKPYKCKQCNKSFSTVSAQKTHLARHSKEDMDYHPGD